MASVSSNFLRFSFAASKLASSLDMCALASDASFSFLPISTSFPLIMARMGFDAFAFALKSWTCSLMATTPGAASSPKT